MKDAAGVAHELHKIQQCCCPSTVSWSTRQHSSSSEADREIVHAAKSPSSLRTKTCTDS